MVLVQRFKRHAFDMMKSKQGLSKKDNQLKITKVRTLSSNEEYVSLENDQFYDSPCGSPIGEIQKSPMPKKEAKFVHRNVERKDMTKS